MLSARTINRTQQEHGGEWMPACPMLEPLSYRARDAWAVLTGRAHAISWPHKIPRGK